MKKALPSETNPAPDDARRKQAETTRPGSWRYTYGPDASLSLDKEATTRHEAQDYPIFSRDCLRIASEQQPLMQRPAYLMATRIAAGAATKTLVDGWCLGFRAVTCATRCLSLTLRICGWQHRRKSCWTSSEH